MSLISPHVTSLHTIGLEDPSPREFLDHPDLRTITAFFLGWAFITGLRYLILIVIRHSFTKRLVDAILQRPTLVTIAERRDKASEPEGHHVQNWLRDTFQFSANNPTGIPKGARQLSVVLTVAFTVGIFMSFLSLVDFRTSDRDVLCIVVIAWAGISVACAKLAGLLQITFDLQQLGTGVVERVASWVVLVLSFGATLAHVTISIGTTRSVPQIQDLALCYRKHFLATSLTVSLLNISLELYFTGRMFSLLVPQFLQFHHQVEVVMDVRMARVASLLILDLLTILPSAMSTNVAAEFIPFSLGALIVLAAFNHQPSEPIDSRTFQFASSHQPSVIAFPRNKEPDELSVISENEDQAKPDKYRMTETERQPSSRRTSFASEPESKRHARKSRVVSRASRTSYDSEAEARSVRGAVVSFAFRSHEMEPMPAMPYGIYQPKLVGPAQVVPGSSKAEASPAPTPGSESRGHSGFVSTPSPLSRHLQVPTSEQRPLPLPKPSLGPTQLLANKDSLRSLGPSSGTSSTLITYGSDGVGGLRKPEPARRGSSSTVKTPLSPRLSCGYTGPDLRHYSMGGHSSTFEARDYNLDVLTRPTGLFRSSTFGSPESPVVDSGASTPESPLGSERSHTRPTATPTRYI